MNCLIYIHFSILKHASITPLIRKSFVPSPGSLYFRNINLECFFFFLEILTTVVSLLFTINFLCGFIFLKFNFRKTAEIGRNYKALLEYKHIFH